MRGCRNNRHKDSKVGKNAACSVFSSVLIFVFMREGVCVYDMCMCMYMMCICMLCVRVHTGMNMSRHACKDQRISSSIGPCLSL